MHALSLEIQITMWYSCYSFTYGPKLIGFRFNSKAKIYVTRILKFSL